MSVLNKFGERIRDFWNWSCLGNLVVRFQTIHVSELHYCWASNKYNCSPNNLCSNAPNVHLGVMCKRM